MFFHTMKYTLLNLLRDKGQVFWCVAFPLLLGTMFHFAFGGLGSGESFSAIPVAVVMQEESSELRSMLDSLSKPGEDQFLEVTYASAADAKELLKAKEVYGIITADLPTVSDYRNAASAKDVSTYPLSLTLSAEMTSDPLYQSILSVLVDRFNIEYSAIAQAAMKDPTKLPALLDAVSTEVSYIRHESLGAGSVDESLTYFFNLIAMTCLCGCLAGLSLGFLVGCIGQFSKETKFGFLMAAIMICCFLSGLMIGNMRALVEDFCPLLNRINPAALISDALYSLVVYPSYTRFFTNIAGLLLLSALFCLGGLALVRRKKYASL